MYTKSASVTCYHCGLECHNSSISFNEKTFCCLGCKTAFEILDDNDLCTFYDLNQNPGATPNELGFTSKFSFLNDTTLQKQLLDFTDGNNASITLSIPTMHCSSCVWLLESLYRIDSGISKSTVNFLRKSVHITYRMGKTNLQSIVELLASLGYEPEFNLQNLANSKKQTAQKKLYIQIGIAGFAFANIMLLSLPDYFARANEVPESFIHLFGYLNILLGLPVLLFSAKDYYISAWKGIRSRAVNMDIPIALGISTLFIRSLIDIFSGVGQGWMDSFSGLVFFLLIGKLFQEKTYQRLSFDRDYTAYFPLYAIKVEGETENSVSLETISPGDRVLVRNNEIIPADSILINGIGNIDYSFVTGESDTFDKISGDMIYAGGKQVGSTIEIEVVKPVSQGYLTQLWNHDVFHKQAQDILQSMANAVAKYFTTVVIVIAVLTFFVWFPNGLTPAFNALTAVLIVACPCALALTIPFTFGTALRYMGKVNFYLKNTTVVESLARVNSIVFDKTGTMTETGKMEILFHSQNGSDLSADELRILRSTVRHSTHPLSRKLTEILPGSDQPLFPDTYEEIPGKGIKAIFGDLTIFVGSNVIIDKNRTKTQSPIATRVNITIDGKERGYYEFMASYRKGLGNVMEKLKNHFSIHLLSGDNDYEKPILKKYFQPGSDLLFNQSPEDKMNYILKNQTSENSILMIGDGINDAGALKASNIGISLTEDIHSFSPACDGILAADSFPLIPKLLAFSKASVTIVKVGFIISFLYNLFGITLAMNGVLSPLTSAILMPISSLTIVIFSTGITSLTARKMLVIDW